MDDEMDRTVVSDTKINCTRVPFKGKNNYVYYIYNFCVLYCFFMSLFCFNINIQ